jgi:hypothetical protein
MEVRWCTLNDSIGRPWLITSQFIGEFSVFAHGNVAFDGWPPLQPPRSPSQISTRTLLACAAQSSSASRPGVIITQ